LPKRADEVLAGRKVDAGLATDGGVDHRQQARGDVHDGDAAMPRRGREAGEIGHHPTADGDDDVTAREAHRGEPLGERLDRRHRLHRLALADGDHLGGQTRRDVARDAVLGHECDAP
jgi:hypothetical protein